MIYFTSDIHFNDMDTLISDNRPFKSTKQFDKYIISMWNKQTKKEDTIYVIGDFMDCNSKNHDSWKKSVSYVKKIKASIILIMGNNEDRVVKYFFDNDFEKFRAYCIEKGFKEVYKNLSITFNDKEFYLTHKPLNYKEGTINLFGHLHSALGLYLPCGFNIGCDLNHFRLYSELDIEKLLIKKEKYWDIDKSLNNFINKQK